MKKWRLFVVVLIVVLLTSFQAVKASSTTQLVQEKTQKLDQIKEKRRQIKDHLKENQQLEKEVEKKSKKIDKLLVDFSRSKLIQNQSIEEQIMEKLEALMTDLMQIGEVETASWKHLKMANKQIKAENYDLGIKNLDKTISNLLAKHEMLISFSEKLDEFITYLNSLQYK